ncbi:integrase catalytic domain-containing protein [Trichonephila clavipes]|nr:integrase catalytic domain-containing protein [Trichonephila clavipes]
MKTPPVYLWSDSTIALAWIQKEPNLLKTFGANRVATIQHLTNAEQWHHVSSEQNPADLISRGLDPSSLLNNSLWWNGPKFLTTKDFPEKNTLSSVTDNDEFKRYLSTTEKMTRHRIRAHYEQLSEFERGRIIGQKEAGWANWRIARHKMLVSMGGQ